MPDEIVEQKPQGTALTIPQTGDVPTMWNNRELLKNAWSSAQYLAKSDLVPEGTYKGKPENCLIALDMANRMNISPLLVMQNLYVVKGKPAWSGSFCAAAINGCGKFTPLDYVWTEDGCCARAKRIVDGSVCTSETITMRMAADEGWLNKAGSKWKTMPKQMMMYRSASFFARAYCPEVLLGVQTIEEVQDTFGYEDSEKAKVIVTLEDNDAS